MKAPDYPAAEPYVAAKLALIPLHKWDKETRRKGKNGKVKIFQDGKRPRDSGWVTKPYDSAKVLAEAAAEGINVGVRLGAEDLIVDVDPRNFEDGEDSLAKLEADLGLDLSAYPAVETGGGGLHIYMKKPADLPTITSVDGYPGVELKSRGTQIVAAGMLHPTGSFYEWDFLRPPLSDGIPPAPERLLALARRPEISATAVGGGEYSPEQIGRLLEKIDPARFSGSSEVEGVSWQALMMACHHATGGEAREEFIEWSTSDPDYQGDYGIIGRRWDSLSSSGPDGSAALTYRTLAHLASKLGLSSSLPQPVEAEEDFGDSGSALSLSLEAELGYGEDGGEGAPPPPWERKGPMALMNDKYWAVLDGGKFRIMSKSWNPELEKMEWTAMSRAAFSDYYANRKVERVNGKGESVAVPLADAWIEWPGRRTRRGVVFDPERDHPGFLNLWTGWGVEPSPSGSWDLLQELIYDVLCDGSAEAGEYVMNWLAYMVQKPGEPAETALAFRGDQGTGKSTLGGALVSLAGQHGLQVTSPKHVTGNFNSHLIDCVFLFADEAIAPTDKKAQAALKALITDKHTAYEKKGIDLKGGRNRVHLMMASNDPWFVNAEADGERRYFVSEVSRKRQKDFRFFAAVKEQLYGADKVSRPGLRRMLFDLLRRDITGWAPRMSVPNSSGLVEQKLRNLDPVGQWWLTILERGVLPWLIGAEADEVRDWSIRPRVPRSLVKQDYEAGFGRRNGSAISSGMMFWKELRKYCPNMETDKLITPSDDLYLDDVRSDGRVKGVEFPSLEECRKDFEELLGGSIDWD